MINNKIITLVIMLLKEFDEHHSQITSLLNLRNRLFNFLTNPSPTLTVEEIVKEIENLNETLEKIHSPLFSNATEKKALLINACKKTLESIRVIRSEEKSKANSRVFQLAFNYINYAKAKTTNRASQLENLILYSNSNVAPTDNAIINAAFNDLKANTTTELLSFLANAFVFLFSEMMNEQKSVYQLAIKHIKEILEISSDKKIIDLAHKLYYEKDKLSDQAIIAALKNQTCQSDDIEAAIINEKIHTFLQAAILELSQNKSTIFKLGLAFTSDPKNQCSFSEIKKLHMLLNSTEKIPTDDEIITAVEKLNEAVPNSFFYSDEELKKRIIDFLKLLYKQRAKNHSEHNKSISFLFNIPESTLLEIFKFSNFMDLIHLKATSHYFNQCVTGNGLLQKKLNLTSKISNYKSLPFFRKSLSKKEEFKYFGLIPHQRLAVVSDRKFKILDIFTTKILTEIDFKETITYFSILPNNLLLVSLSQKTYIYETQLFKLCKAFNHQMIEASPLTKGYIALRNGENPWCLEIWRMTNWEPISAIEIPHYEKFMVANEDNFLVQLEKGSIRYAMDTWIFLEGHDLEIRLCTSKNSLFAYIDNKNNLYFHDGDKTTQMNYKTGNIEFMEIIDSSRLAITLTNQLIEIRNINNWELEFSKKTSGPVKYLEADSSGNIIFADKTGIHACFFAAEEKSVHHTSFKH